MYSEAEAQELYTKAGGPRLRVGQTIKLTAACPGGPDGDVLVTKRAGYLGQKHDIVGVHCQDCGECLDISGQ